MFPPHTVFVLGAGASFDLGLPTGDQLRGELMSMLERDGQHCRFRNPGLDRAVAELCRRRGGHDWTIPFEEYAAAAARIRDALPMAVSIDNLLHTHRHDRMMVHLGKMAIAGVISQKEASSHLSPKTPAKRGDVGLAPTNTVEMTRSWYLPLMRLLATGRTLDEVGEIFANVSFVVFNYDRCLEHFLANAIINYFQVSPREAADAVKRMVVHHPYGQIGDLPWQAERPHRVRCAFGDPDAPLIDVADQILTFTESADKGVVAQVKEEVARADTLILMGFGFLRQNVELMTVAGVARARRVFATTYGIGENDVEIIISEIEGMLGSVVNRDDTGADHKGHFRPYVVRGTCRELMDSNWLRLTRR